MEKELIELLKRLVDELCVTNCHLEEISKMLEREETHQAELVELGSGAFKVV